MRQRGPPIMGPPCGIPPLRQETPSHRTTPAGRALNCLSNPPALPRLLRWVTRPAARSSPPRRSCRGAGYQTEAQRKRVRFGEEAQWNEFAFAYTRKQMIWNLRRRSGSEVGSRDNASLPRRAVFAGTAVRPGKEAHRNHGCLCASLVTFCATRKSPAVGTSFLPPAVSLRSPTEQPPPKKDRPPWQHGGRSGNSVVYKLREGAL